MEEGGQSASEETLIEKAKILKKIINCAINKNFAYLILVT
jgi:precorrin isomerase